MPKNPQNKRARLKQLGMARLIETGKLTASDMVATAKENLGGIDRTVAHDVQREIKEEYAHMRSGVEDAVDTDTRDVWEHAPELLQRALHYIAEIVVGLLQQQRTKLRREADVRSADDKRAYDAALDVVRAERDALQEQFDVLRKEMEQAEQAAHEAHERAAVSEQALAHDRAQMEQRQAEHHAQVLRLTERIGAAQQDKDDALRGRHE